MAGSGGFAGICRWRNKAREATLQCRVRLFMAAGLEPVGMGILKACHGIDPIKL